MSLFKLALTASLLEYVLARKDSSSKPYYRDTNGRMHVKLDVNNEFKIMQLTDLHFGESDERDQKTINMIKEIIRKENPDFMAITGDLISGQMYDQSEENATFWVKYFR